MLPWQRVYGLHSARSRTQRLYHPHQAPIQPFGSQIGVTQRHRGPTFHGLCPLQSGNSDTDSTPHSCLVYLPYLWVMLSVWTRRFFVSLPVYAEGQGGGYIN